MPSKPTQLQASRPANTTSKNNTSSTIAPDLDLVDAYDYELPEELIAAHPAARRTASRLLVATRPNHARRSHDDLEDKSTTDTAPYSADEPKTAINLEHRRFTDLCDYLQPGDLLVFNNTRVIPARVMAHKSTGGAVELLVLDVLSSTDHPQLQVDPLDTQNATDAVETRWTTPAGGLLSLRCMTRSSRALRPGMKLQPDQPGLPDFVVREYAAGTAIVDISWEESAVDLLTRAGKMPLPPYIVKRRKVLGEAESATVEDQSRYQTVYAAKPGAVAAPTAGLHFSDALIEELERKGVRRAFVTLQVGAGTFQPISADRLSAHHMHSEEYEISAELAEAIAQTRARGGRIIAVGTTSARALEAEARRDTPFEPGARRTDIFLYPGESFKVVDGLITNFHLPRSTLLALVAAFIGYESMRELYQVAVAEGYRFYSYGDSTLLI